jgi:hypothetical protein
MYIGYWRASWYKTVIKKTEEIVEQIAYEADSRSGPTADFGINDF